jgi:hypothetical protein
MVVVYPEPARLGLAMMNCSSDQQQFEEFHLMDKKPVFGVLSNTGPLPTTIQEIGVRRSLLYPLFKFS